MRRTIVLIALLLAGCDKWTPATQYVPPPTEVQEAATQASDFSKPVLARGTEPFWTLTMDGAKLTLSRPQTPDQVFETPGGRIVPGQGLWEAKSANGQALTLKLFVSVCSDGMSDHAYPMNAEVVLRSETLRGCAAKVSEMPKAVGARG